MARDLSGLSESTRFNVSVAEVGYPVVEHSLPDTILVLGQPFVHPLDSVFTDPDPATLTFSAQSSKPSVAAVIVDQASMLRVTMQVTGVARITVTATNRTNRSTSISFQVSTSVVNAVDDERTTEENTQLEIDVLANDQTNSPPLTLEPQSVTDPPNGIATATSDNTILYTPDDGFIGKDRFTYHRAQRPGRQRSSRRPREGHPGKPASRHRKRTVGPDLRCGRSTPFHAHYGL